jgi:hypothetical protein
MQLAWDHVQWYFFILVVLELHILLQDRLLFPGHATIFHSLLYKYGV